MTDMQAALGASQMDLLDSFVLRRNVLAQCCRDAFAQMPLRWQAPLDDAHSSFHCS